MSDTNEPPQPYSYEQTRRHVRDKKGMVLSDYPPIEIKQIEERATLLKLRERLHSRKPVFADIDTARLVREERNF